MYQMMVLSLAASTTKTDYIKDAKGKLAKLNSRSQRIYVEYLSDWPRAENYTKKLYKMQSALSAFLTKCGYDLLSISALEGEWQVDLNGDGVVEQQRSRRSDFAAAVLELDNFWADFDADMDEYDYYDDVNEKSINSFGNFSLFGNDEGGFTEEKRDTLIKIRKLFNGYEKFVQIYLSKCKKLSKIKNRVFATNRRMLGAVQRYEKWVATEEIRKQKEEKKEQRSEKQIRKEDKRSLKIANFS